MKILIVDDEFVSRTKLLKILSAYGECHQAVSGAEAIEALSHALEDRAPYHLVTVDIRLGDMEGQQLVTHIRTWERQQNLISQDLECQILMVTAMTDSRNILSSFKQGCEQYVKKPFNSISISAALACMGFDGERVR